MNAAVREALLTLADRHGGQLTPELVVEAARPKDSPLHPYITWDARAAAEKQRLYEARRLIRSVRVEIVTVPLLVKAPMFVRDPSVDHQRQGYVSTGRLRTEADQARDVLVAEFTRVLGALRRAKAVAAVLGMDDAVMEIEQRVTAVLGRAQQEEPQRAVA